jgi:hypothetical protein
MSERCPRPRTLLWTPTHDFGGVSGAGESTKMRRTASASEEGA